MVKRYLSVIVPASIAAFSATIWATSPESIPDAISVFLNELQHIESATVHRTFAAAFACMFFVDLTGFLQSHSGVVRNLLNLLIFINALPFVVYSCLSIGIIQPGLDNSGHPIIILRYVQWMFTTPTLIYLVSNLSGKYEGPLNVKLIMFIDWVMITTGLLGSILPQWPAGRISFFISMAAWITIQYSLWNLHTYAINSVLHPDDIRALKIIRIVTVIVWSIFPTVWVLQDSGFVKSHIAEILFCSSDLSAKIVYSLTLRAGSYMSIERLIVFKASDRELAKLHPNIAQNKAKNALNMVENTLKGGDHSLEAQQAFLRSMSHEMMTPLNEIMATQSELLMDENLATEQRKEIVSSLSAINDLQKTLDNAMKYSELSSGTFRLVISETDLIKSVESCIDTVAKDAVLCHIKIDYFRRVSVPRHVLTDTGAIKTILTNILDNAVKFSPSKSKISVKLELDEDASLDLLPCQKMVKFTVRDGGIGIPKEKISEVFKPFTQLKNGLEGRAPGTGIGLTIVKGYLEKMAGSVVINSGHGGTVVIVQFPVEIRDDTQIQSLKGLVPGISNVPLLVEDPNPLQPEVKGFVEHVVNDYGAVVVRDASIARAVVGTHRIDYDDVSEEERMQIRKLRGTLPTVVVDLPEDCTLPPLPITEHLLESALINLALFQGKMKEGEFKDFSPEEINDLEWLERLRVLEVDDVRVNRKIVVRLLKKLGVKTIHEADDGDIAVEMTKKNGGYDLICMDISMPRMSGIVATKEIRQLEASGAIPKSVIVGITAHGDAAMKQQMIECGMDNFHHKPVSHSIMENIVGMTKKKRILE